MIFFSSVIDIETASIFEWIGISSQGNELFIDAYTTACLQAASTVFNFILIVIYITWGFVIFKVSLTTYLLNCSVLRNCNVLLLLEAKKCDKRRPSEHTFESDAGYTRTGILLLHVHQVVHY